VKACVLVTSAGSGAGNNLIRSLKAADPELLVVGGNADRFVLARSMADRNYLLPPAAHPGALEGLRQAIAAERVDLLLPANDADVRWLSRLRRKIPCRLLLPRPAVIERCQDKYALTAFLRARGLPAPITYPVTGPGSVGGIFRRLAPRSPLWCRIRTGSSSMGAIPVRTPEQARSWMGYWAELRGVPLTAFTLSEYLPGREFSVQGLWNGGELILIKMCECLSYFGGWNQPSGVSSTPALARTLHDPRVIDTCRKVVGALDPAVSGVFSIDLKEDAAGTPCVTEINAGRFCMITSIYDFTGKHSMVGSYVRMALGEPVDAVGDGDIVEDHYLIRDLDTLPGILHADELFHTIRETRALGARERRSGDDRRVRVQTNEEPPGDAPGLHPEEGRRRPLPPRRPAAPRPSGEDRRPHQLPDQVRGAEARTARRAEARSSDGAEGRPPHHQETPMSRVPARRPVARIQIRSRLDRRALEALRLELGRLARRHGVELRQASPPARARRTSRAR
jgi:hypothetical protein